MQRVHRVSSRSLNTVAAGGAVKVPKQNVVYRQVLSGVQPTGCIHIGNYFGALENWATMQSREPIHHARSVINNLQEKRKHKQMYPDYEPTVPTLIPSKVLYTVVDLHAITILQDPKSLRKSSKEQAATLLAQGIDPKKAALFLQSHVQGHSELMWQQACNTPLSKQYRMTQFKDKAQKQSAGSSSQEHSEQHGDELSSDQLLRGVGSGLLMYPVLMAADILLYNATHVPVGDDQTQHLEMTRELARIMNHQFGKKSSQQFVEPECVYTTEGSRVMSLKNATSKMSKSDPVESSRLNLGDSDAQVRSKVKGAQTDSLGGVSYDPAARPGVSNLVDIALAAENAKRRRAFLSSLNTQLENTTLVREGYLSNPDKLHQLAFNPEFNSTFDALCTEYMALADSFEAGVQMATHQDIVDQFALSKLSIFKEHIGEQLANEINPIREKTQMFLSQEEQLHDVLRQGADYANTKAKRTMQKVHAAMGYVLSQ